MAVTWKVAARRWDAEKKSVEMRPAISHPLQGVKDRTSKPSRSAQEKNKPVVQSVVLDPLSSILDGPDPLSDLLGTPQPRSSKDLGSDNDRAKDEVDSSRSDWEQKQSYILGNFTTTGTLTFTSSFLQPSDTGVVKTQTAVTDRHRGQGMSGSERLRVRLEQLDTLDEAGGNMMREVRGLSQEEFVHRLSGLKQELTEAWNSDQRVKALKITIQCVKLLSLSAPEHFYPSKFVLVVDVMETLSSLVYQRLRHKFSGEGSPGSGGEDTKLEAQETARNWFYKISSIRELLPRLYMEIALLPCYSITSAYEGEQALCRLSKMIRGIGDPLIAAYAGMYLCRMGVTIAPTLTQYISETIEDLLHALKQGLWPEGEADMNMGEQKEVLAARVFYPPLEWMMQCLANRASHHVLQSILRQCEGGEGLGQNLLVAAVLNTFPHSFVAQQSLGLTHLIAGCTSPGKSQHELVSALGNCVNQAAPPQHQQLALLNAVWKLITRIPHTRDYLSTAGIWLEFTAKHFTSAEVNTLLGDVLKHMGYNRSQEQVHYPALLSLVSTALTNSSDPYSLYSMNNFLGLLSVFQRDTVSAGDGVTRGVVEALLTHHPGSLTDPTLIQHILTLCSALHDSINALTTDDERRQLSQLIISFIRQVDFGRDFEQQLEFYVNARAAFSNLDPVLVALIQCVCQLGVATWSVMHGQHSGRTAAFVRACAAYCFITVPSLSSPVARLKLYLLSGTVALLNNCIGQGDACMKAAIREVLEVAGWHSAGEGSFPTDVLLSVVNSLAATLITVPDPPDASPPLYLLRGLVNAIRSYAWPKEVDIQALLSISLLQALSAAAQDTLPYHFHSVEGNDSLYGGDPQVCEEAESLCTTLLQDTLTHVQGLTGVQEKRCGPLVVTLFWCMVTWCDLTQSSMLSAIAVIWSLVQKHCSPGILVKTREAASKNQVIMKNEPLLNLIKHSKP